MLICDAMTVFLVLRLALEISDRFLGVGVNVRVCLDQCRYSGTRVGFRVWVVRKLQWIGQGEAAIARSAGEESERRGESKRNWASQEQAG